MCRVGLLISMVLILSSCKKEDETIMVTFSLQVDGFSFIQAFPDSPEEFSAFSHHMAGGEIFFHGTDKTFSFRIENDGLEHQVFEVPVGTYQMEFRVNRASIYGQAYGSFKAESRDVILTEETESIPVNVIPTCGVFLIRDKFDLLDQQIYMIERHAFANGFFTSYPLIKDRLTGLYYTYFTPDTLASNPSAYLWFYEGEPGIEEGGLPTFDLDIGIRYDIEILQ